jgi:hypothetical protein
MLYTPGGAQPNEDFFTSNNVRETYTRNKVTPCRNSPARKAAIREVAGQFLSWNIHYRDIPSPPGETAALWDVSEALSVPIMKATKLTDI